MPTRSLPHSSRQLSVFIVIDFFYFVRHLAVNALTLLIRNLDRNLDALQFADDNQRYPTLEAFFARCLQSSESAGSTTAWVCASFGIERQYDWPAGAILAQARGEPDTATFWVCAAPVHLAIDRDDLILQPRSQLRLSERESRTLFSLLEPHFAEHELEMKHVDTGLWCVGSKRAQHLETTDIELAEGRSVDGLQPSGNDAAWWQRLLIEAQMSLHEHPVNLAREERGDLPINSLWLWAGGTAPAVHKRFDTMCVADPLLRGAASVSQARLIEMPNNALDVIAESEHALVEITMAAHDAPDAQLEALESDWFAPAWQALANGRLDQLTVVLPQPNTVIVCHCDRKARRRFWKRRRALSQAFPRFLTLSRMNT
ncbi:MAG: hypothetical protein JSU95_15410 [Betaproteobacteria bacterium]|nr:MAG: hypothetical protein JSU95_15410 [Betaproteobacteria bacterium]